MAVDDEGGFDRDGKELVGRVGLNLRDSLPSENEDLTKRFLRWLKYDSRVRPVVIVGGMDNNRRFTSMESMMGLVGDKMLSGWTSRSATASVASDTITAPTGRRYIVFFAAAINATRSVAHVLSITPFGGAAMNLVRCTSGGTVAYQALLGAQISGTGPNSGSVYGPLILDGGDSLTITDTGFVAADTVAYNWLYVEVIPP